MEFGHLRVSRYGNSVMIENLRNQEEHEHCMEKLAERYPVLCKEINDAVSEIAEIVHQI